VKRPPFFSIPLVTLLIATIASAGEFLPNRRSNTLSPESKCIENGWEKALFEAAGLSRKVLWKAPPIWTKGAILVLHGGGGKAADFCSGGLLLRPQIAFTDSALARGFAVFALESTDHQVTDGEGRDCGRRFDFAPQDRPNIDLPYIEKLITEEISRLRPKESSEALFLTGLSTGGYMTILAATAFGQHIRAFAPVAAGDPYGTTAVCDPELSPRKVARGILMDSETSGEITRKGACSAETLDYELTWPETDESDRPTFKQFHHRGDGIVDYSCMQKAKAMLTTHGYKDQGAFVLDSGKRHWVNHFWQEGYNEPLLDFFEFAGAQN